MVNAMIPMAFYVFISRSKSAYLQDFYTKCQLGEVWG